MRDIRSVHSLNNVISNIGVFTTKGNYITFHGTTSEDQASENGDVDFKLIDILVDTWVDYIENCFVLDFLKNIVVKKEGIQNMYIYFEQHPIDIEIIPLSRNLFTDRPVMNNRLFGLGALIDIRNNTFQGAYDSYVIELKQDIYVEEDPSKHCMIYPNATYQSYNHCDKAFVHNTLARHFGPDFTPIWATGDLGNVTISHYVDWETGYDYFYLFDGSNMSNCPIKCLPKHQS